MISIMVASFCQTLFKYATEIDGLIKNMPNYFVAYPFTFIILTCVQCGDRNMLM